MNISADLHPTPPRPEGGSAEVVAVTPIPVTSSQIAAIGYDPAARRLVVRFRGSGRRLEAVYSYDGVPAEIAAGLVAAASPGIYFNRHIRHGGYPFRCHQGGAP